MRFACMICTEHGYKNDVFIPNIAMLDPTNVCMFWVF